MPLSINLINLNNLNKRLFIPAKNTLLLNTMVNRFNTVSPTSLVEMFSCGAIMNDINGYLKLINKHLKGLTSLFNSEINRDIKDPSEIRASLKSWTLELKDLVDERKVTLESVSESKKEQQDYSVIYTLREYTQALKSYDRLRKIFSFNLVDGIDIDIFKYIDFKRVRLMIFGFGVNSQDTFYLKSSLQIRPRSYTSRSRFNVNFKLTDLGYFLFGYIFRSPNEVNIDRSSFYNYYWSFKKYQREQHEYVEELFNFVNQTTLLIERLIKIDFEDGQNLDIPGIKESFKNPSLIEASKGLNLSIQYLTLLRAIDNVINDRSGEIKGNISNINKSNPKAIFKEGHNLKDILKNIKTVDKILSQVSLNQESKYMAFFIGNVVVWVEEDRDRPGLYQSPKLLSENRSKYGLFLYDALNEKNNKTFSIEYLEGFHVKTEGKKDQSNMNDGKHEQQPERGIARAVVKPDGQISEVHKVSKRFNLGETQKDINLYWRDREMENMLYEAGYQEKKEGLQIQGLMQGFSLMENIKKEREDSAVQMAGTTGDMLAVNRLDVDGLSNLSSTVNSALKVVIMNASFPKFINVFPSGENAYFWPISIEPAFSVPLLNLPSEMEVSLNLSWSPIKVLSTIYYGLHNWSYMLMSLTLSLSINKRYNMYSVFLIRILSLLNRIGLDRLSYRLEALIYDSSSIFEYLQGFVER